MNDLKDLIKNQLQQIQVERAEQMPSGYRVKYYPCNHSRKILIGEHELMYEAMENVYKCQHDEPLLVQSTECPICNKTK